MPSHFLIYFMSMHLSIQFAAIFSRPPYEPFTPSSLINQILEKDNKCTSGLH